MAREITSASDIAATRAITGTQPNDFKDRLVKLIPSEIVTAYITLQGLISGHANERLFTSIVFGSLLLLTPFYLKMVSGVTKPGQIIFTTVAFIIWFIATGGGTILFPNVDVLSQFSGSLILIIYTLIIPFVYKG